MDISKIVCLSESDDSLKVNYYWPDLDSLNEEVSEYVYQEYIRSTKKFILFNLRGEGLAAKLLIASFFIVKHLVKTHAVPLSSFRIICGAAPIQSNIEFYLKHCEKYQWPHIHITFENTYQKIGYGMRTPSAELFITTPRIKPKLLLSYNSCYRHHRSF